MDIVSLIKEYWFSGRKTKQTQKGWITGNACCCHHNGHNRDTRSRGNFLFLNNGHIIYNCYNCGFKTGYMNSGLSSNFESLMRYLGIPQEKIQQLKLDILNKKLIGDISNNFGYEPQIVTSHEFNEIDLPSDSIQIKKLLELGIKSEKFINCITYLKSRGEAIETGWDYYWSSSSKWDLNNRVIVPFKNNGKIVGWTGRYIGKPPKDIPKYFNSDIQDGYLFNGDTIYKSTRKYIIIVEGPFDAISIDCVSPLGSTMNKSQIHWLNLTDKEKIVVPDRQRNNQDLIDVALNEGWSVSFPEWEENIKDVADAQCRYGQLYTVASILSSKTNNKLQIGIKRQMFKR